MSVFKQYKVEIKKATDRDVIHKFKVEAALLKKNHYSGKVCKYMKYIAMLYNENNQLIGTMQLGLPSSKNAQNKYAPFGNLIELKRLACINNTPKNTESFFIGAVMRWFKTNTDYTHVLSYSDQNEGHEGIIYKASNFRFIGETPKASNCVVIHNEKQVPTRTAYNKNAKIYEEIMKGRELGTTYNTYLKPKNIYLYDLKGRR